LSGRHKRIIHEIKGNGTEIKNHGQKGLPIFFAIRPPRTGKNNGNNRKVISDK
jgi:hypothetical protein